MTKPSIKKIGLLCSGGDAPGMNCAIRAVTRTAIQQNLELYGIQKGYSGLLAGHFQLLHTSDVGNILQRGGTILQTSRCPEFHKKEARKEAANLLKRKNIDALIVIGGDGSFNGAQLLSLENDVPVIGIPGTIDNDISGTDYTLGFNTAVQTAIDAVDKIRDTASSHERTFIVEVMGRKSSSIAVQVGVCTGAENIVLPQNEPDVQKIVSDINRGIQRGKSSSIIIVAEGESPGLSYEIQSALKSHNLPAHVCILGHTQRGGSPSAFDRFIGSKMGYQSVMALVEGEFNKVTAYLDGKVVLTPFENCLTKRNDFESSSLKLAETLSI